MSYANLGSRRKTWSQRSTIRRRYRTVSENGYIKEEKAESEQKQIERTNNKAVRSRKGWGGHWFDDVRESKDRRIDKWRIMIPNPAKMEFNLIRREIFNVDNTKGTPKQLQQLLQLV
jgi:hypothetical protein